MEVHLPQQSFRRDGGFCSRPQVARRCTMVPEGRQEENLIVLTRGGRPHESGLLSLDKNSRPSLIFEFLHQNSTNLVFFYLATMLSRICHDVVLLHHEYGMKKSGRWKLVPNPTRTSVDIFSSDPKKTSLRPAFFPSCIFLTCGSIKVRFSKK